MGAQSDPNMHMDSAGDAPTRERRRAYQLLTVLLAFAIGWFVLSHWGIGDSAGDAVGEALGAALGLLIMISIIGAIRTRGR